MASGGYTGVGRRANAQKGSGALCFTQNKMTFHVKQTNVSRYFHRHAIEINTAFQRPLPSKSHSRHHGASIGTCLNHFRYLGSTNNSNFTSRLFFPEMENVSLNVFESVDLQLLNPVENYNILSGTREDRQVYNELNYNLI